MSLPRPRPTVVIRDVSEGAILFCTDTETYYSLNPMGVRVWRLLPPVSQSEEEIVATLLQEHPGVSPEMVAADVSVLLKDLLQNKLVEGLQ